VITIWKQQFFIVVKVLLSQILNHTGVCSITEQLSTQNDFVICMIENETIYKKKKDSI
jgi:hypothetical protein